jgi:hypothetical protein
MFSREIELQENPPTAKAIHGTGTSVDLKTSVTISAPSVSTSFTQVTEGDRPFA